MCSPSVRNKIHPRNHLGKSVYLVRLVSSQIHDVVRGVYFDVCNMCEMNRSMGIHSNKLFNRTSQQKRKRVNRPKLFWASTWHTLPLKSIKYLYSIASNGHTSKCCKSERDKCNRTVQIQFG